MTDYYAVEPEVAGGWGENTVFTTVPGKGVVVQRLHYKFDGWLGDELLESAPCFIVSERMAQEIERAGLTGVRFDDVQVTVSEEFMQLEPERELPKFLWLKVEGFPGREDFGIASGLKLVVSERALGLLRRVGFSHAASITPFARTSSKGAEAKGIKINWQFGLIPVPSNSATPFPRLKTLYVVGNALAIAIMLLAGVVNLILGPRNPLIFIFAFFEFGFGWVALVLFDALNQPQKEIWWPFWWRGKRIREYATRLFNMNNQVGSLVFLSFETSIVLLMALLILYSTLTRTINPAFPD
jgi:hypothetical protein